MRKHDGQTDIERLRGVLDVYGADPRRWPKLERGALLSFSDRDAAARKMRDEAAALDRVLAAASMHGRSEVTALSDRILAAATPTAPLPIRSGQIHELARHRADREVLAIPLQRRVGAISWPAAAALAASLLLGFYVGVNNLAPPSLQQVAGIAQDEVEIASSAVDESQDGELL